LRTAPLHLRGRLPWSSNGTYLVEVGAGRPRSGGDRRASDLLAVYKPEAGERPLWDFPTGLWRREVAAYELSEHLGWRLVPPTVSRLGGPLGAGSVQLWVEADFEQHYFTILEDPDRHAALRRMALFDVVANNADRKAGHCLLGPDGRIWGIDHGVCFHRAPKLRTVIWDFAGEAIEPELIEDLTPLSRGEIPPGLEALLAEEEVGAVVHRALGLCRRRRYPAPTGDFPYPWPLI
jgi:uncharacterized repeat protein (TIGR03843 family)